jgi:hypothetical protein
MQLIVVAVKYLCHNCNCIMWIFELVAFQKSDFFFSAEGGSGLQNRVVFDSGACIRLL